MAWVLSRQEIEEIKSDFDAGRVPQIVFLGVYPKDCIMAMMIFYVLEDEYNAGRLPLRQFAEAWAGVSEVFFGGDQSEYESLISLLDSIELGPN